MSREQCLAYLAHHGWSTVTKSACVFCPYRGNAEWRRLRDTDATSWDQATAFDQAYRTGPGMTGQRFLHGSCLPLTEAPIERIRPKDLHQTDLLDAAFAAQFEHDDPDGCSPWGCRSGAPVNVTSEAE
jgi:hypothetical protein